MGGSSSWAKLGDWKRGCDCTHEKNLGPGPPSNCKSGTGLRTQSGSGRKQCFCGHCRILLRKCVTEKMGSFPPLCRIPCGQSGNLENFLIPRMKTFEECNCREELVKFCSDTDLSTQTNCRLWFHFWAQTKKNGEETKLSIVTFELSNHWLRFFYCFAAHILSKKSRMHLDDNPACFTSMAQISCKELLMSMKWVLNCLEWPLHLNPFDHESCNFHVI